VSSPGEKFHAELATLRDEVSTAITDERLADLESSLEMYVALFDAVLREFRRLEDIVGPLGADWTSAYGREMSWIDDDVLSFVAGMWRSGSTDVSRKVLGFLYDLLHRAYERREINAFGSVLQKYRNVWRPSHHDAAAGVRPYVTSSALLELENFGDLFVARDLRRPEQSAQAVAFAARLVVELAELMRIAVDTGDVDGLRRLAQCLVDTMSMALEHRPVGERRSTSTERPAHLTDLIFLKGRVALAVEAWVLLRLAKGKNSGTEAAQLLSATAIASPLVGWRSLSQALESRPSQPAGWDRWETELWEGRRGGSLSFDAYIRRAFLVHLLRGLGVETFRAGGLEDFQIRQLREELERMTESSELLEAVPSLADTSSVARLRASLEAAEREIELAEDEEVIERDVQVAKVAAFRSAAASAWNERRRLRFLVDEERTESLGQPTHDEATSASSDSDSSIGALFGINTRVLKVFFLESDRIHADPAELGRDLGASVAQGEDEAILSAIARGTPAKTVTLLALADRLSEEIGQQRERGLDPSVLVLNSWPILGALESLGLDVARVEPDAASALPQVSTELNFRYHGGASMCVVGDLRKLVRIVYSPPGIDGSSSEDIGMLHVAVLPIDASRAGELVQADLRFRLRGDVELSPEEAVRRLQLEVHVRVFSRFAVTLVDPSAATLLQVVDDPEKAVEQDE
jgi:hypothetical protein